MNKLILCQTLHVQCTRRDTLRPSALAHYTVSLVMVMLNLQIHREINFTHLSGT